jgi:MFS family permease
MSFVLKESNNTSRIYGAWVLSIYVLGFAFGPLLVAPLSELYGRLPTYHIFNTLFLVFIIACAVADSIVSLTGFRFLAGLVASCPLTLGAGTIADMITPNRRGIIVSVWTMGPLFGYVTSHSSHPEFANVDLVSINPG